MAEIAAQFIDVVSHTEHHAEYHAEAGARDVRSSSEMGSIEDRAHHRARTSPGRTVDQPPTHRRKVRADGRCAVRATLFAANAPTPPTVNDVSLDDSVAARAFIRATRIAAVQALVEKMQKDEDLDCAVRWSFPDEAFDSFEAWLEAQHSDDTDAAVSSLWHGGGQWLLFGLALLLRVQLIVHVVETESLTLTGPPLGTELVDARPTGGEGAVVRLASMRAADGTYDHFDVLLSGAAAAAAGADPLGNQPERHRAIDVTPRTVTPRAAAAPAASTLLGWAALCVAVFLSLPNAPAGGGGLLAQVATTLLSVHRQAGEWPAMPTVHGPATGMAMPPVPGLVLVQ
jgi:hypothetical protein